MAPQTLMQRLNEVEEHFLNELASERTAHRKQTEELFGCVTQTIYTAKDDAIADACYALVEAIHEKSGDPELVGRLERARKSLLEDKKKKKAKKKRKGGSKKGKPYGPRNILTTQARDRLHEYFVNRDGEEMAPSLGACYFRIQHAIGTGRLDLIPGESPRKNYVNAAQFRRFMLSS